MHSVTGCSFSGPQLSNNLSDYLKTISNNETFVWKYFVSNGVCVVRLPVALCYRTIGLSDHFKPKSPLSVLHVGHVKNQIILSKKDKGVHVPFSLLSRPFNRTKNVVFGLDSLQYYNYDTISWPWLYSNVGEIHRQDWMTRISKDGFISMECFLV